MTIANSGCTTTKIVQSGEYVGLDSIQMIEPGQRVSIHTNKKVDVQGDETFSVFMIVTDVNAVRIQGDLFSPYDEYFWGTAFEVNVEDISSIALMEEKTVLSERTKEEWAKVPSAVGASVVSAMVIVFLFLLMI